VDWVFAKETSALAPEQGDFQEEKLYVNRNSTHYCVGSPTDWGRPQLALQQELGVLPERPAGNNPLGRLDYAGNRSPMNSTRTQGRVGVERL
jgi:hypothetical protein